MRRLIPLFAAGALLVGVSSCGGDDDTLPTVTTEAAAATTDAPVETDPPSTPPTTVAPTMPPTSLVLPQPVDPPPEDGSTEPHVEIGTIEIPKIGLTSPLQEGIRLSTLNNGPGHWPGSAMPGQVGNAVIAGHRVSHNAEFRKVDALVAGDEVIMTTADGRFVYAVVSTEIVKPDAMWVVDQTPERTATLFACHPPGSVRERIVVHLALKA